MAGDFGGATPVGEPPSYDELPPAPCGGRSAWHVFGHEDNVGTLNLQTPERIAAAARLVRRGAVFALSAEVRCFTPPLFDRAETRHQVIQTPGDPGLDDMLDNFNPQASSQWDSLAHVPYAADRFYNGVTLDDVLARRRNTIDHWARRGIAGRGVMLDLQPLLRAEVPGYDPGAAVAISVDQLERCRREAGVDFEPGDILMLHTGFLSWYLEQDDERRTAMGPERSLTAVGVEHSEDMARYLWDTHASAVVSDSPAVEVWPPDPSPTAAPFGFLHQMLIGQFGMALGELWWLAGLADDCRRDGVTTMFVTSAPLYVAGGIGSTPNALAIK